MTPILSADDLNLAGLRLFLTVIELGSVSKAASRLGLAQPSATAKLQKLERFLGAALLERGPTGSVPTATGQRLAPACADVLTAGTSLVDRAAELRQDDRAQLTVATTRHVASHLLPAWITAADLHETRVEIIEGDTLTVAGLLRSGDAMIGFVDGPGAPLGLRSRVVGDESLVAVVGPTHPWFGRRRAVTAEALASSTLVLRAKGSGTLDVIEAALAGHGAGAVSDSIEVSSSAAARLIAMNGAGIALLPACEVAEDLADGRLAQVRVSDLAFEQPVRIAWRGDHPASTAARRLRQASGAGG
jgi:DNA-binding transcriptional LysR family regulator